MRRLLSSALLLVIVVSSTMNGCASEPRTGRGLPYAADQVRPAGVAPPAALGGNVTLSDAGLVALDLQESQGKVIAKRDVPGPGVEFDIRFPSNRPRENSIRFSSARQGGAGLLAGLDLAQYENFALTFTLVAVDGDRMTETGGALVIGALVHDSANNYRYRGEVVDMGRYHGRTKTSVTPIVATARQDGLGFSTHMFVPDKWSPGGSTVTLLVQPAVDAAQLP